MRRLNPLGALLVILNVVTILGPVAGVVIVYQNNLQGMVVPSQVQDLLTGNSTIFSGQNFTYPQFVSSTTNVESRTVTIVFNFTNPFDYDLMINSVTANIVCKEDNFTLGQASLAQPVDIPANQTVNLVVNCQWTQEAENHFATVHQGASSLDVTVTGLTINVNDITVTPSQSFDIPNIPLS